MGNMCNARKCRLRNRIAVNWEQMIGESDWYMFCRFGMPLELLQRKSNAQDICFAFFDLLLLYFNLDFFSYVSDWLIAINLLITTSLIRNILRSNLNYIKWGLVLIGKCLIHSNLVKKSIFGPSKYRHSKMGINLIMHLQSHLYCQIG